MSVRLPDPQHPIGGCEHSSQVHTGIFRVVEHLIEGGENNNALDSLGGLSVPRQIPEEHCRK